MNYFTKENLLSSLEKSTNFLELKYNEESSVIISEYGGRPLGIFPKEGCYSLLWISPNLNDKITKRNREIGGDRYWISPERTFFFRKPKRWRKWSCPEGLDPAEYKIKEHTSNCCILHTPLWIENHFSKEVYKGEIIRSIKLINEPIATDISYCGIEIIEDCTLNKPNLKVNGWNLANVISGGPNNPGTVLIPTKKNPRPLSYIKDIPINRLNIINNHVEFKIDVNKVYKLAIRPEDIDFSNNAKIGYFLKIPNSDEYGFLLKISNDIPTTQNECFDVAKNVPNSEIGVIQSYNSKSKKKSNLMYGEIELQLNMFKTKKNQSHGIAKHQLLAYIGKKKEIINVIEIYMGIKNPEIF